MPTVTSRRRILFFVSEDWYFWSHRRHIAAAAVDAGYDVWLATRVHRYGSAIHDLGINLVRLHAFSRKIRSPAHEVRALRELVGLYDRLHPDIVHHVALKPALLGTIAARFVPGRARIVNTLGGLGTLFPPERANPGLISKSILFSFRLMTRQAPTVWILQNDRDRQVLIDAKVAHPAKAVLIPGSGADPRIYKPRPEPPGPPLVLFASRLLKSKGVIAFLQAARSIKHRGIAARFAIAGASDDANPQAVSAANLRPWVRRGIIEYWGHVEDMPAAYQRAHLFCLPTHYGEGVPKVLIEAAACGLPAVTSDISGCREIIRNGYNGLTVPIHDISALTQALIQLITDDHRRLAMKKRARQMFMERYTDDHIVSANLDVWASCHSPKPLRKSD